MKTGDSCRNELEASGRRIRTGSGAGSNCCADSLLQLMAHHGLLHPRLSHDAPARTNACRLLREALVVHDDERLRPRLRTNLGTIDTSATDSQHDGAYLQHDVHGEFIVRFLLEHFHSPRTIEPRGVRVIVYTRLDSPLLRPEEGAVTFGRTVGPAAAIDEHPLIMELYNNTGDGVLGFHYDPVFPSVRGGDGNAGGASSSGSGAAPSGAGSSGSAAARPPGVDGTSGGVGSAGSGAAPDGAGNSGSTEPPPPEPHPEQPRRRKRQKTADPTGAAIGAATTEVGADTAQGYFAVRSMPPEESPDPRCKVELALERLAAEIRREPTVPADPALPTRGRGRAAAAETLRLRRLLVAG